MEKVIFTPPLWKSDSTKRWICDWRNHRRWYCQSGGDIPLKQDIHITDLSQGGKAATARAWLPAVELHYQFGKTGVNKFRPYIGAGVMYAYFNDLK